MLDHISGRVFEVDGHDWEVYFEVTDNGYIPVITSGYETKKIPLILSQKDVKNTILKLHSLSLLDGVSFGLFRDIVAGAALLSMKYDHS